MLVAEVQFLYVIHQIGRKRQIEASSDCPEHNGTDINRPVCVQVGILICLPKVAKMVCQGSKHDAVLAICIHKANINYVNG